jgi:hypothetical protein
VSYGKEREKVNGCGFGSERMFDVDPVLLVDEWILVC